MINQLSYRHTINAAYIGYVTQAIINNFAPLLFITFCNTWSIPLSHMAILVFVNFGIQLTVDIICAKFVDRIGYRVCIIWAHILAGVGLISLGILPFLIPNAYVGIIISIAIYAVGGGLTEVLISPIVESCPTSHKESEMSLLHSFYCWGHVLVIILSTLFFHFAGINNWPILAIIWAIVPLMNAIYFGFVPIRQLNENTTAQPIPLSKLFKAPVFWLFILLMFCSGASEQAMSQWASAFAEAGLGVSKTYGDLLGPCMFAIFMGLSRLLSSFMTKKFTIKTLILGSSIVCLASYLIASLSPIPVISLIGCGLCGLSVGIMWPGTFSMAARACKGGGTALFAMLAMAGDIGCMGGPAVVSLAFDLMNSTIKQGMIFGIIFPIVLIVCLIFYKEKIHKFK